MKIKFRLPTKHLTMLYQSLKLSLRNILRKPVLNVINLLGLSLSMAMVIILSSYCYREFTTDHFRINGNRTFLVSGKFPSGQWGESILIHTPGILSDYLDSSYSEILKTVRIQGTFGEKQVLKPESRDPFESDVLFVDEDFFDLFNYTPVAGNLELALKEPMSVVLTRSEAGRIFGRPDALGETLMLNGKHQLMVTAIIEEPGENTFLTFDVLIPLSARSIIDNNPSLFTDWKAWSLQTFVLIRDRSVKENIESGISSILGNSLGGNMDYQSILLPVTDVYFSGIDTSFTEHIRTGNRQQVIILTMITLLILVIAMINFINILSSQYFDRIKQAGVQKIMGASQYQLIRNILTESSMMFALSALLAIILATAVHANINRFIGIQYMSGLQTRLVFILFILAAAVILGVLASLSPAIIITRSEPAVNLQKNVLGKMKSSSVKSMLVISQFVIAIALVAFTVLVQKQIRLGIRGSGFKDEKIIGIKLTPQLLQKQEILMNRLIEQPDIARISFTEFFPGSEFSQWLDVPLDIRGEKKSVSFNIFDADAGFFDIMGLRLSEGRFFSYELATDKYKVLVNETFLSTHQIGDPIGATFSGPSGNTYEIIGVVRDFHFKSIDQPIAPLVIKNIERSGYCLAGANGTDFKAKRATMKDLTGICTELSPGYPVELCFLDTAVENMYQGAIGFRRTFSLLTACAILISCMGIFALSLFICQSRTREIGIRKTYGATIRNIFTMLNSEFMKWILIAFFISCPVALYFMKRWLENYAYKTPINVWIFVLVGCMTFVIALISVSGQTYRTASKNPADVLRNE